MTFNADWMRAFDRIPQKLVPRDTPRLIVYGGEDRNFGDTRAVSPFTLASALDTVLGGQSVS